MQTPLQRALRALGLRPRQLASSRTIASPPAQRDATAAFLSLAESVPHARPGLAGIRWAKFLSYYRPHTAVLVADLLCAVLIAATALALPLSANFVVKRLADAAGSMAVLTEIYTIGAAMLALLVVQALCTLFVDYQGHVMGARMETAMRKELFEHYQKLSFNFFDGQKVGQLMSRISHDLFDISELYHHGPEDIAISVLKFGGAVFILLQLDLSLTLMIIATTPFAAAYALYFNGRMERAWRQGKERIAAINERVEDALSGIRVVKSFGNEALEIERFDAANNHFLATRRFGYRAEAYFSVGLQTYAQLITLAVIVLGAVRILGASLSVADLMTYLLCVAILIDPIQRAANFARLWQQGITGFHRFMDVLQRDPDIRDSNAAIALDRVRGEVRLRNVSYRYPGRTRDALHNISLTINAGEFVALVGYSGVGKSTLCALLPRFYDVSEGAVLIDGHNVKQVTLESLRRNIGVVQQDVYLFAGTVAENLAYGRPGASRAEIVSAARHANAHAFIAALPNGYDTDIGQRGVRLSGGQKQRLTIARAFLKDPPILIFDEATSALDTESERAVQQALLEIARGRTTLVIAHRLSTIRHADRIVVLTDEGVAEQGTHAELMAAQGLYFALHDARASL